MKYSVIIPVYNRPDELSELLASLQAQTCRDFEVIVVEDGSEVTCEEVCARYASLPQPTPSSGTGRFPLHYYTKENGGPGAARNYGAERAHGDYYLVLDSDVVLPPGYLAAIDTELQREPCDAFGGPDRAHSDFTPVQKAISYAMTSFFTTGGIRGGARKLDKFYPRSFNMGVSRALWQQLGGFRQMRFGEDIDLSIRIFKAGARCRLFPEAWVWHKRRTDFRRFFRQVRNSGAARINLHLLHPGSMKLVHMLPALFTAGCVVLAILFLIGLIMAIMGLIGAYCQNVSGCNMSLVLTFAGGILMLASLLPLLFYSLLIFVDSTFRNQSLRVGFLSIPAALIQLTGYGSGFLRAAWHRLVLRQQAEGFDDNAKLYQ